MKQYVCTICGYVYDEAAGIPSAGIAAGTKWEELPPDWVCPLCGAVKADFKENQEAAVPEMKETHTIEDGSLRKLTTGEISALCSNLARGCEKQYLNEESGLFTRLADYFKSRTPAYENPDTQALAQLVEKDLNEGFPAAGMAAKANGDRGALRALVWSEKVTRILNSILSRYEKEGEGFLASADVYVCDICGFVFVGEAAPDICPVCKVPGWKFTKVERR